MEMHSRSFDTIAVLVADRAPSARKLDSTAHSGVTVLYLTETLMGADMLVEVICIYIDKL